MKPKSKLFLQDFNMTGCRATFQNLAWCQVTMKYEGNSSFMKRLKFNPESSAVLDL